MPNSPPTTPTRRTFCSTATALLLTPRTLFSQTTPSAALASTHPDVAAIDHDRILTQATRYLTLVPTPITTLPCPRSPGTPHDYYSEALPEFDPNADTSPPTIQPFTAHRDALFTLGLAVPALAAAHLLTHDDRYAAHAVLHLRAWFIKPATAMAPSLNYGSVLPHPPADNPQQTGRPEGILETLPLVEIAQSIPFLAASSALTPADLAALKSWFAAYLLWLTVPHDSGPRLAALARDRKDHNATSWLLQVAAFSLLTAPQSTAPAAESSALADLRHRFRTVTLRAQIRADGTFPNELRSINPYRDSLLNLDILAAICLLLSTRFDSVWDYQLDDGPGMRSAIAYHFPFIADRTQWPFRADATRFNELPGRRPSLLFCARAYQRPEYAALWLTLPPDPPTPEILRSIPIHQPLLWVRQPPRTQ
jgi:hypothetical protein